MTKSLEPEVTDKTLQWLRAEFKEKAMFDAGEIQVGEEKWRADIVGYDKILGTKREIIAVECKGKYNISRGVGQALSYSYAGVPSMISGYCIDEPELKFIEELPLYCLNIKENSVELVSKPDNPLSRTLEDLDRLIVDRYKENKKLREEKNKLSEQNNKLHQENKELRKTIKDDKYKYVELVELCKNLTELQDYDVSEVEAEDILRHLINEAQDDSKYNYVKPREFLSH